MSRDQTTREKALAHIDLALGLAVKVVPWFGGALRSLIPAPLWGMRERAAGSSLAVTERWLLIFDPEAVLEEPLQTLAAGLIHEAMHPLRLHFRRARGLDAQPEVWNLAADAEMWTDIDAICRVRCW